MRRACSRGPAAAVVLANSIAAESAAMLKIRPCGDDEVPALRRAISKVIKLCPSQKHDALRVGGHLAVRTLRVL